MENVKVVVVAEPTGWVYEGMHKFGDVVEVPKVEFDILTNHPDDPSQNVKLFKADSAEGKAILESLAPKEEKPEKPETQVQDNSQHSQENTNDIHS